MKKKPSNQLLRTSIALAVLALALSACGGSKDGKNEASPSASSASPSASASPSESPSESPSPSAEASAPASDVLAGFKLFEDKSNGTSIQYPEDWKLVENAGGAIAAFLAPAEGDNDKFQENVNIIVQDLQGQDITLEQYAQISKDQINQLITDAKIVSGETFKADDGTEFYSLIYNGKQGEYTLTWQQVFAIANGKAYIMTYTAEPDSFDKYVDTVGQMADTWIF
ncbi:hypothetical protein D7Z26_20035 [Cohnella endophytica]|uniref:PsbP C-terminal domain-containing protein n=1 Tax=Cohnella endophytica TaxID=2419778 RepID=A0A494XK55_9BACL|nr:PsbP-related protein [Cohnella endophytica]RKP50101.1 hypothetical protein D7Z26_20035 [Cohnella endophytica]